MGHSNTNLIVHVMWSTRNQEFTIDDQIMNQLLGYLTNTIKILNGRVFSTSDTNDHLHLLFKYSPDISLADILQKLKANSSGWLKTNNKIPSNFSWQEGYSAFSVSKENVSNVCRYIESDASRHAEKKISYLDELAQFLNMQSISYDTKYYMRNSFSKLLLHVVWSTKNREPIIDKQQQPELYQFIRKEMVSSKAKIIEIGGVEDHVHILIDAPRHVSLSDLMEDVKAKSSSFMNRYYPGFAWQVGYGAFSIGIRAQDNVVKYIQNQEEHHKTVSLASEWNQFFGNV